MKKYILTLLLSLMFPVFICKGYTPGEANLKNREEFSNDRFGIFIHWGLYSLFGQGEWYLNNDVNGEEYSKSAKAFYPIDFNAKQWVKTIKDAGAKYICFTTRHHDGFSMFKTEENDYNIVDGTPFKREISRQKVKFSSI